MTPTNAQLCLESQTLRWPEWVEFVLLNGLSSGFWLIFLPRQNPTLLFPFDMEKVHKEFLHIANFY